MKPVTTNNMVQELELLSLELERTRSELCDLRRRQYRATRWTKCFYLGSLVIVLLFGTTISWTEAQNSGQPAAIVTRLQAPVLVQDKSGRTIVELSDRAGFQGVTVFSPVGDAAFLGYDKENKGLVQVLGPGRKILADATADGFKFFGTTGQSVAFLGADSNNNGALQLKNSTGGVVAEAGAIDANKGVMQVYPKSGKSPFPIPNYIQGSK
jgi:hypothetical protein